MSKKKRSILEEKWAAEIEPAPAGASEADDAPGAPGGPSGRDGDEEAAAGELERLRADLEAANDRMLRAQAELVNFRRRTDKERREQAGAERAAVLREVLPVLDDFERAVAADDRNASAYREGVELILRSLQEALGRLGLQRLEPAGEPFDPHLHEAVERRESAEVPEGHVVSVYKPGYRLGERLVRPAAVVVSTAPAARETGDRDTGDAGAGGPDSGEPGAGGH